MNRKLHKGGLCLLASIAVLAVSIANTPAAEAADVDELEAQMRAMEVQLQELKRQVHEAKAQAAAATSSNRTPAAEPLNLKVKWKGAPELSNNDGKFKFKVRGRINVDYNGIDQDTAIPTSARSSYAARGSIGSVS